MPKVLISDKLSESAVDIFKKNKIETIYKPGLSHDELLKEINRYSLWKSIGISQGNGDSLRK